jgi:hypothetical protein
MWRILKLAIIVFSGAIVAIGGLFWLGSRRDVAATQEQAEGPHGTGTFGPYEFVYMSRDDTFVAIFKPFLAREDAVLVGAIHAVVRTVYGRGLEGTTPVPVGREIAMTVAEGTYFVLPIKQTDSGQVHTLVIRFSPR